MVFLIEGVDGCGKTTVVEHLKKQFPEITCVKESYPGDSLDKRIERLQTLQKFVTSSSETVVYDRTTALDEFIYEPVIAKKDPMLNWDDVKPLLSQCVVIYLECGSRVVSDRLRSRGDELINESMLQPVVINYSNYLDQLPNVVRIDVTEMNEKEESEAVVDAILTSLQKPFTSKKPKLAHIVPRDLLYTTINNQYHMSLAHLIKQDEEYRNFYRRMVVAGRYVLMDNGAAENAQLSLDELYDCWKFLKPTELILPDTLCDKDDTISKARVAIPYFKGRGVTSKFMAVPQGKSFKEWKECAAELIRMANVHCLGVSKFLTVELRDPSIRYEAVKEIVELKKLFGREDIEIHLLGCDAGPSEVTRIFKDFSSDVRGCDTALAYIYAQAGVPLEADSERPTGEMSFLKNTLGSNDVLTEAMKQFNNITNVVNNFGDITWS